jgi:5-methylcytosine-specific restriction enzyme A
MASPITVYKNNDLLFEAKKIQQAAAFLAEQFNSTKNKYFNHI